jgi:hypothetical protein
MPSPFETYTLNKAREQIPVDTDVPGMIGGYAINRRLYDGDHWLDGVDGSTDGAGWIGPRPSATETDYQSVLTEIRRAFISKNAVREVVERHIGGVVGQEPSWKLTPRRALGKVPKKRDIPPAAPTPAEGDDPDVEELPDDAVQMVDEEPNPAEQALIDEAETALTEWWDVRGAHGIIQDVIGTLLLARRGILRLFVPPGLTETNKQTGGLEIPKNDLAQSLARIYIEGPDPTQATVVTDKPTQRQAGIHIYRDEESKVDKAELVYLNDQGQTIIRILDNTDAGAATAPLDLGGRLTIYEMKRAALVTPQVRQQQYLLNMACTMMGRNVVLAGFLERILLNVQLPGVYEGEGVDRRFVPDTFRVGAGTTNALMGATYVDEMGITRMATPSVVYRDPVPVDTFVATKADAYTSILEETDQLHAQISGDATASGESRKQARADFEMSLLDTQEQVNRAGRWLLETLLAMAAAFSGQPGKFAELRAVFECRIDTGPMGADDQSQVRENVKAGLMSEETGMARIGIDDVDAELERIAAERDTRMAHQAEMLALAPPPTPPSPNGNGKAPAFGRG